MRYNMSGVPSTITVDGRSYPLSFNNVFVARMNNKQEPDYVRAEKLDDLPERIRAWVRDDEAVKADIREAAARKRALDRNTPDVYAMYGNTSERVLVRGVSSRRSRYGSGKLLITRANGDKEAVSPGMLTSLSSDRDNLVRIEAERKQVQAELEALKKVGSTDGIRSKMRYATLEVTYNADSATFTGLYEGFLVEADNPREVERQMLKTVIAHERPYAVEEGEVISYLDRSDRSYYDYAWVTEGEAERYITLTAQSNDLDKEFRLARQPFSYEQEVEKARAKQS